MVIKERVCLTLLAYFFFFSSSFIIAQEVPFTLKELCEKSSDIVIGTIKSMNSYTSDNGKHVYTDIDIAIEQKLKGQLSHNSMIKLTMYGGNIDGITTYVVGFPKFYPQMKSFYFLKEEFVEIDYLKGPQRVFNIVGLTQGKMDIIDNKGETIVLRDSVFPLKMEEGSDNRFISLSYNNPTGINEMNFFITNLLSK